MNSRRLQSLVFLFCHLKAFFYLFCAPQKEMTKKIAVLEQLITKSRCGKSPKSIEEFLVETYADAMFEHLEKGIPTATEIVSNVASYKKALQAYHATLNWQRKVHSLRLYKSCYRAALCCCRLGNFSEASDFLNEGIHAAQNEDEKQALLKVRAACSRLQELSPDRNLWEYLLELQRRNITTEEADYLELIQNAMNGIRVVS